jgi:glycosyltransferase involved in cell wall biosynthesis
MKPLISVVTPTWHRHAALLEACIPSVAAQTYPNVEHIVVSDGPDAELRNAIKGNVVFEELPAHDANARWGHWARLRGIELAKGDLIAYLDDDNYFRPNHLELLASALDKNADAYFAYSRFQMHPWGSEMGADVPVSGQIDTSVLMHWRPLLEHGNWEPSVGTPDWDVVDRWMKAGARWAFVNEVTMDKMRIAE